MAYPPGSSSGNISKNSGGPVTEDELKRLNDAKIQFGSITVEFTRMSGRSHRLANDV